MAPFSEVGELCEIFQWRGEVPEGLPGWAEKDRTHLGQEPGERRGGGVSARLHSGASFLFEFRRLQVFQPGFLISRAIVLLSQACDLKSGYIMNAPANYSKGSFGSFGGELQPRSKRANPKPQARLFLSRIQLSVPLVGGRAGPGLVPPDPQGDSFSGCQGLRARPA